MLKKRYIVAILFMVYFTSCAPLVFFAGTVTGIGSYKYYHGVLTVVYEAPYIETWEATLQSLDEMGITIERKKHDLTSAKIVAKQPDKKTVTISILYKSSQETEMTIRVGFFGNKDASDRIKEKIRVALFE